MQTPTGAAAYEHLMGRWSRLVAREFVAWLGIAPFRRWLDVGCGTGALAETILDTASPLRVYGVDPEFIYVAHARQRLPGRRTRFLVGDAHALPSELRQFDATVSALALNLFADPAKALREMIRVTRDGGVVGAYVWDFAEGMRLMRHFWDAAAAVEPSARELDPGTCFPLCRPGALQSLFSAGGLRNVEVHSVEVMTRFSGFDDYWTPFLLDRGRAGGFLARLDVERQKRIEERARAGLLGRGDGEIVLPARAWAVMGVTRHEA
jgi:SAM-dependent methyltransferase